MIEIQIKTSDRTQSYLKHFSRFNFDTMVDFILELFVRNEIEPTRQDDETFSLIKTIGYERIQDIPDDILKDIESVYNDILKEEKLKFDNDKLAYVLLDNLKKGILILMIDNKVVNNLNEQIIIKPDSVITFFDTSVGQDISFKTL
ncbi:MAG: hypothetical protein ACEPOZ_11615 [Marinifilaceae bacterium]